MRPLTPAALLTLRASLDMTQGEVAEALGISLSAYHRRERGLVAITREMVLAMERPWSLRGHDDGC